MSWLPAAYLVVSTVTLTWQAAALARLLSMARPAGEQRPDFAGLRRTVSCRVAVAVVYVVLGVVTLIQGALPLASLAVFGAVQLLWLANSVLDLRPQHRAGRLSR